MALSSYLDANVLVAIFTVDAFTGNAHRWLASAADTLLLGDFAAAEFASALSRKVRVRTLWSGEASIAFGNFDHWAATAATWVEAAPIDTAHAAQWLRALTPPLRTPDALDLAIAQRLNAKLITFDAGLARAAQFLGVQTVLP